MQEKEESKIAHGYKINVHLDYIICDLETSCPVLESQHKLQIESSLEMGTKGQIDVFTKKIFLKDSFSSSVEIPKDSCSKIQKCS